MQYEKEFMELQMANNGRSNNLLCALLFVVEGLLTLGYFLSQTQDIPTLEPGYLWFYLSGMAAGLAFPILDRLARRRRKVQDALRYAGLGVILVWAALFSAYDVRHGNGGWALSQVLLFTSTALRLPKAAHYGINTAGWGFYVLFLTFTGADVRSLYSEVINSGVFLVIACIVIHINMGSRYASFLAARNQVLMRADQLDAMAEQVEQMRHMAEQVIVIRHDLRHYAWEVKQGVDRGDLAAVGEVTRQLLDRLGRAGGQSRVRSYTGLAACDAVLSRYEQWAAERGVSFRANIDAPRSMEAQDLTLLLMNALENAAKAVEAQGAAPDRFIRVQSGSTQGQYFLEIANSCTPGAASFRDGLPVTAEPGHGYGVRSMASILERYDGVFRFQEQAGVFRFFFLLPSPAATGGPSGPQPPAQTRRPAAAAPGPPHKGP